MLIRSETGTPTYRAADVVYLADKLDRGHDRAIYVLGADHHGTRNWYAAVARMLGYDPGRVEVLLYQLVHLTRGGAAEKTAKNPVYYVQYAHARIAGILRNAGGADTSAEPAVDPAPEERDLIKRLAEFPTVVAEATERRGPHAIPNYAIRVADDFHRFYTRHKVIGSDAQAFRLGLITATKSVIARSLGLVGVEAPERM